MKRLFLLLDLMASDAVVIVKYLAAPVAIFCFSVVSLSIAGVIAYTLLGQSDIGLSYFGQIMNLTGTPIVEPVRLALATLNWFALFSLVAYSGFFFGSRYFTDLHYRLIMAERQNMRASLTVKEGNGGSSNSDMPMKNAANS